MKLFAKAGKSDSAAHLAMKHGIDKEQLSLALQVEYSKCLLFVFIYSVFS